MFWWKKEFNREGANMKVRTVYFKVKDMRAVTDFWEGFFGVNLFKKTEQWSEFKFDNIRFGFLLNDFGSQFSESNGAVMFEFPESELQTYVDRALKGGAKVIENNLNDPSLRSISLVDPFGNEFECGIEGTHH
jgi:predicted enzyme related to lactoylglutathione lyase